MNRILVFDPREELKKELYENSEYSFYIKNDAKEALSFLSLYSVLAVVIVGGNYPRVAQMSLEKRSMPIDAPTVVVCTEEKITEAYKYGASAVFYGNTTAGFLAVLKNAIENLSSRTKEKVVTFDDFSVSLSAYKCISFGETVAMPKKEIELLYTLAKESGKVFSRNEILDEVWGVDFVGDPRTVDVHIARIRKKIEKNGKIRIETIPRAGYRFCI